jgi:HPt (histidine-containing phosphotransfer) domain-containing protein
LKRPDTHNRYMNTTKPDGGPLDTPANLVDLAAVHALAADVGADRLGLVLEAFCSELVRRAPVFEAALDAADLAAIQRESHSLTGSALTFGARVLGAAARRANDACRAGDVATALAAGRAALELMPATRAVVTDLIAQQAEHVSR